MHLAFKMSRSAASIVCSMFKLLLHNRQNLHFVHPCALCSSCCSCRLCSVVPLVGQCAQVCLQAVNGTFLVCSKHQQPPVVQFHDYHGVMSLLYLPAVSRPNVLYVAHNSDYNGVWPLGLQERTKYLFSMFALPLTAELQM